MDKRSKVVFLTILILICLALVLTFNRAFIVHDYEIFWDDYATTSMNLPNGSPQEP